MSGISSCTSCTTTQTIQTAAKVAERAAELRRAAKLLKARAEAAKSKGATGAATKLAHAAQNLNTRAVRLADAAKDHVAQSMPPVTGGVSAKSGATGTQIDLLA